jgi:hypothetical protein
MDNLMPSQNKNARAIDADSAPSKPHSSFVGSRFCCDADIPSLKAPGKSAMTLSFQVVRGLLHPILKLDGRLCNFD